MKPPQPSLTVPHVPEHAIAASAGSHAGGSQAPVPPLQTSPPVQPPTSAVQSSVPSQPSPQTPHTTAVPPGPALEQSFGWHTCRMHEPAVQISPSAQLDGHAI